LIKVKWPDSNRFWFVGEKKKIAKKDFPIFLFFANYETKKRDKIF
jgi:hypothetical protein